MREDAEHLGEEVVPRVEPVGRVVAQLLLAFDPGEQQGVRDRLRVGVRELGVVGVGEEDRAPLAGELREVGLVVLQSDLDRLAQEPRERREGLRECPRRPRDDRLPEEEVPQERFDRDALGVGVRRRPVRAHVPGGADDAADARAVPVERPLVPVRVEEIRVVGEALELRTVVLIGERTTSCSLPGCLQLDVPRQ